jgi:biopolymer transport protein ExbB/TolQ
MEQTLFYLTIALGVLVVALLVWIIVIHRKLSQLTRGKSGASLEDIITHNNHAIAQNQQVQEKQSQQISILQEKIQSTLQHVGIVRYNPFKETGGNQSFAIALTDEHKNGVVISSLYTRERVNVFAKPLENGGSSFQLTAEEEQAIAKAHEA